MTFKLHSQTLLTTQMASARYFPVPFSYNGTTDTSAKHGEAIAAAMAVAAASATAAAAAKQQRSGIEVLRTASVPGSNVDIHFDAESRREMARELAPATADAKDLELAERIVLTVLRLAGTNVATASYKGVVEPSSSGGGAPDVFEVRVTHVRYLTASDMALLLAIDPQRILGVRSESPSLMTGCRYAKLFVRVRCHRVVTTAAAPKSQVEVAALFQSAVPAARRKKLQTPIDWAASNVTRPEDAARLARVVDELYNLQLRVPARMRFWIEPMVAPATATTTTNGGGGVAADEDSADSSTGAYYNCNATSDRVMGYWLRVRSFPGPFSTELIDHLRYNVLHDADALLDYCWITAGDVSSPAVVDEGASSGGGGGVIAGGGGLDLPQNLRRAVMAYGEVNGNAVAHGTLDVATESELTLAIASASVPAQKRPHRAHPTTRSSHPGTQAPDTRAVQKEIRSMTRETARRARQLQQGRQ